MLQYKSNTTTSAVSHKRPRVFSTAVLTETTTPVRFWVTGIELFSRRLSTVQSGQCASLQPPFNPSFSIVMHTTTTTTTSAIDASVHLWFGATISPLLSATKPGQIPVQIQMAAVDIDTTAPPPPLFCLCSILDETLEDDQHLDDCELQLQLKLHLRDDANLSDTSSSSTGDSHATIAKRRKHRESMARLRLKMRNSIAELKIESQRLERMLQRTVAHFPSPKNDSKTETETKSGTNSRHQLQQKYYALVKEQLALQDERRELDQTHAQQTKYERLVQRELLRASDAAKDFDHEMQSGETKTQSGDE